MDLCCTTQSPRVKDLVCFVFSEPSDTNAFRRSGARVLIIMYIRQQIWKFTKFSKVNRIMLFNYMTMMISNSFIMNMKVHLYKLCKGLRVVSPAYDHDVIQYVSTVKEIIDCKNTFAAFESFLY